MKRELIEKVKLWSKKTGTKRVIENFTWLTVFQVLEKLIPLITIPYLIRTIGIEKWGLTTFALSFIQYFNTFVDYGFNATAVREVSFNQDNQKELNRIFSEVMFIKFFLTLISFIIFLAFVLSIKKFSKEFLVFLFTFGWVVGQMLFPLWFFQGMEKMKFSTILSSFAKIVFLALIFIIVKKESDYFLVPLLNSMGMILAGIIGLLIVIFNFKVNFIIPDIKNVVKTLKESGKVFISNLFISFYTNTRIFALGLFTDNTIVGYYGIAEKIAFYLGMPFGLFAQAMYPRLSNFYAKSKEKFYKLIKYLNIVAFLWGICLFTIGILFSSLIVLLLTGKTITYETKFSLIFLLIGTSFVQINTFRIQYFLVTQKINTYTKIHITSGIIGMIVIFLLSYFYSFKGTAISVMLVEGLTLSLSLIYGRKRDEKNQIYNNNEMDSKC
jgi:PST family polysaccharide transporter